MISRRSFIHFGAAALVGSVSPAAAAEPVWIAEQGVGEFAVVGDEIISAGSHLRALDIASGQQRRSARLNRQSDAEGPARVTATARLVVFGWYVWHGDVYVSCFDPQLLTVRWRRRIAIVDAERENVPQVFPLIRPEAVFVFVSNKFSENLFRLRSDNGDIVWSRYIPRYGV